MICSYTKCLRFKEEEKQKTARQIRHVRYYEWALKITKTHQEVLNCIRAMVPNDVKGEILEDWYKVSLKEFCEVLRNKLL